MDVKKYQHLLKATVQMFEQLPIYMQLKPMQLLNEFYPVMHKPISENNTCKPSR